MNIQPYWGEYRTMEAKMFEESTKRSVDGEADNLYKECLDLLHSESLELKSIGKLQNRVSEAVKDKKWADYEGLMADIRKAGEKIEHIEEKRVALMDNSHKTSEDFRFYAFITRFSEEKRRTLSSAYREMKLEAAKIRFANDALSAYLEEQIVLAGSILEAAFPDRRGTFYGRRGKVRHADMRSVVVNKSF
jgi:hypothetical protein